MMYPIDEETESLLWSCPQCGKTIRFSSIEAALLAEKAGLCKNCRAERTFRKHPELIWMVCDFSKRSGEKYTFIADEERFEDDPRTSNILPFRFLVS